MNVAKSSFRKDPKLRFLIVRREDQELVGSISLHVRDVSVLTIELGYWVRQSAAQVKVTSRSCPLVSRLCIYSFYMPRVLRSELQQVMKKQGSCRARWISIGGDFAECLHRATKASG